MREPRQWSLTSTQCYAISGVAAVFVLIFLLFMQPLYALLQVGNAALFFWLGRILGEESEQESEQKKPDEEPPGKA